jgi:hypothetical protein
LYVIRRVLSQRAWDPLAPRRRRALAGRQRGRAWAGGGEILLLRWKRELLVGYVGVDGEFFVDLGDHLHPSFRPES